MKITIDTKEDSHADLRRVIRMLQNIVGENALTNSPESYEPPKESQSAFLNMFGSNEPSPQNQPSPPSQPSPQSSDKDEELVKDLPEIIPY